MGFEAVLARRSLLESSDVVLQPYGDEEVCHIRGKLSPGKSVMISSRCIAHLLDIRHVPVGDNDPMPVELFSCRHLLALS